jgi:hypothetical protein
MDRVSGISGVGGGGELMAGLALALALALNNK